MGQNVNQIGGQKNRCHLLPSGAWLVDPIVSLAAKHRPDKRRNCGESLRERGPINSHKSDNNLPRLCSQLEKVAPRVLRPTMGTSMTDTSLTKYLTTHLEFIQRAGGSNGSDGGDFEDLGYPDG